MSYIPLECQGPGIVGLLQSFPVTGKILGDLANSILNKETLAFSKVERESVASYVSYLNNCNFCYRSHSAIADYLWGEKGKTQSIITNPADKIKVLFSIARKLQQSVQGLAREDIDELQQYNFSSEDTHDLVLIIAAFCMYNRYVDGLGTQSNLESYEEMGERIGKCGY